MVSIYEWDPHMSLIWCPNLESAWKGRAVWSLFAILFIYVNKVNKFKSGLLDWEAYSILDVTVYLSALIMCWFIV